MDQVKYTSIFYPPKKTKEDESTNNLKGLNENLIDEIRTKYISSIHELMEKIIEESKEWKDLNVIPDKLIIRTPYEYMLIQHFRDTHELNSHIYMKHLIDKVIEEKDKVFESRNENKISTEIKLKSILKPDITIPPIPSTSIKAPRPIHKVYKKHFWSKK
jgi:hypothetical protein